MGVRARLFDEARWGGSALRLDLGEDDGLPTDQEGQASLEAPISQQFQWFAEMDPAQKNVAERRVFRSLSSGFRHKGRVANERLRPVSPRLVTAPEDLELVQRCVAGDRQAQRTLFARERDHVHWTLFRILGHSQHLEDLIQDAFLEVFRSLSTFRGESQLSTWVERCTVRVAYGYFRRKALVPRLEPVHEVVNGAPSAEQRVIQREAARRLYALLDRLEPSQRIAYTLHQLDSAQFRAPSRWSRFPPAGMQRRRRRSK